jgi:hypothetical protein
MAGSRRRYLFIPFLYSAVILGLFALALFGRGFSHGLGEARLTGRYAALPLFGSREVRTVSLSYNGLGLRFSRSAHSRISLRGPDGSVLGTRGLRTVTLSAAGAEITFEGGARLAIISSADGSLSLAAEVTAEGGSAVSASLAVPYTLRGDLQPSQEQASLAWKKRAGLCLLTLPAGSRVDPAARRIVLELRPGAQPAVARLSREAAAGPASAAAPWLAAESGRVSTRDLAQALEKFSQAAWQGWNGPRRSGAGMSWTLTGGAAGFDERIALAMLAESIARGTYLELRPLAGEAIAQALRSPPQPGLTLASTAYVGNLREYTRRRAADSEREIERIGGLLARSDPSFLVTENLLPTVLAHGQFDLVQGIHAFALQQEARELPIPAALGLLECLLDYRELVGKTDTSAARCRALVETRLFPAIRRTDAGLFIASSAQGPAQLLLSVRSGALLLRAGQALDFGTAGAVGRSLLVSSLSLADETGMLPARITLTADKVSAREGELAPEAVYGLLPLGTPLARETPLYGSLGPRSWILSAAPAPRVESTTGSAKITLAFPVGLPHYAVIQGIAGFTQLTLHGIPWRPAPDYAQYSDGYFYDAREQALYLKLTGRVEKEEIVVTY